jgi:hypothetical protein
MIRVAGKFRVSISDMVREGGSVWELQSDVKIAAYMIEEKKVLTVFIASSCRVVGC